MTEVLFALAQDPTYNSTDVASKLEGLRAQGLEEHYDDGFLAEHIRRLRETDAGSFSFDWHTHNAPGRWMSDNIAAPSTVLTQSATVENIAAHLEERRPSHLVVASYLGGYSTFKAISQYAREHHPETTIVAASVGALLDETGQCADYLVKGDQVTDLRGIIGEEPNGRLRPVTVRADTATRFNGMSKESSYGLLVSSLGCWYACDFCPSAAQFGNKYRAPFTAAEIVDAIYAAKAEISPDSDAFTISVAEPQGLGSIKVWKEVFAACRDLPFTCDLVTTTSSKIIQKYDLDELTTGNLRLTTLNIGVESLLQGYKKNRNVDLKSLISTLQGAGISVVSTFIVGLDWHNRENVREEVQLLKELNSDGYIVANLEMQPGTQLYNAYRRSGRLGNVPPQLLSFYGYQAFEHPNFRKGFNDMLPLLAEIEDDLNDGNQVFSANLETFLSRRNQVEAAKRAEMQAEIEHFRSSLDPSLTHAEAAAATDRFAAELYFKKAFRQMDLFHPFILSTN